MSRGKWEKAPHGLWDDAPEYLTPADKWVYLTLKRLTGSQGTFPEITTIAKKAGRGETATRQSLNRLKRAGWIGWEERHNHKGQTSHRYTIHDPVPSESEVTSDAGKRRHPPSESDATPHRNPDPSKTEVSKTERSKTPPPTPSSTVAVPGPTADEDKTFTRFWQMAVKRVGYKPARDAFAAVAAAAPDRIGDVLAAWEQANAAWATWIDLDDADARYVPNPARWLRDEGWNDTVRPRFRKLSKSERTAQIAEAMEGMTPDEVLNHVLGVPEPVAELVAGETTGDDPDPPTDLRILDPVDAEIVATTTERNTEMTTDRDAKRAWLYPDGRPLMDGREPDFPDLADRLIDNDDVDLRTIKGATVQYATGSRSEHLRDTTMRALRDLAAQAVAS